jgi:predicted transcriptional regulator
MYGIQKLTSTGIWIKSQMNGLQLKMARVALSLSVRQTADIAGVSHETITRIEGGREDVKEKTVEKVRAALESAGVEFIAENGGGPGVRLRKQPAETKGAEQ